MLLPSSEGAVPTAPRRDELQERLTMLESKIIRSDAVPQDGAMFQSLVSHSVRTQHESPRPPNI